MSFASGWMLYDSGQTPHAYVDDFEGGLHQAKHIIRRTQIMLIVAFTHCVMCGGLHTKLGKGVQLFFCSTFPWISHRLYAMTQKIVSLQHLHWLWQTAKARVATSWPPSLNLLTSWSVCHIDPAEKMIINICVWRHWPPQNTEPTPTFIISAKI